MNNASPKTAAVSHSLPRQIRSCPFSSAGPRAGYRFVAAVKKPSPEGRLSIAVLPGRPLTSEGLSERAVLPYVNLTGDPAAIGRSLHAGFQ
jgi:hypothetical protein